MTTKIWPVWNTAFGIIDDVLNDDILDAQGNHNVSWHGRTFVTTAPNSATSAAQATTVAGPTAGVEMNSSGPLEVIGPPLAAAVTISGTITFNIWGLENSMTANAGPQVIIERIDGATNTIASTIINSESGVEFGTTSAVVNWTGTPTSTAMKKGDRFRLRILINDIGTMAAAFTVTVKTCGGIGVDGDTWIQFNETVTFDATDPPTGTQLFLTSTSAGVNPGSATELEAWTSRGGGSVNAVTNGVNGYTAGVQITDTGGGTALEWYSRQLQAFTLAGRAKLQFLATASINNTSTGARVEVAVCNSDGTSPVNWAIVGPIGETTSLAITEGTYTFFPSGDDIAVGNGQRLRIRIFIDDYEGGASTGSGQTYTVTYNGATPSATGDAWLIIPQSVTEYIPPPPFKNSRFFTQAIQRAAYF